MDRFDNIEVELLKAFKSKKKLWPFEVAYEQRNGKTRYKYFRSKESADDWIKFHKKVNPMKLPTGIVYDPRFGRTPFLARYRRDGKRHSAYFPVVEEAVEWLRSNGMECVISTTTRKPKTKKV